MQITTPPIDPALVEQQNASRRAALADDYEHLGTQLARRGIDLDRITAQVAAFGVAIPSWGVGTGGTRFARFPGPGEPRNVFEKLADCGAIQQLTRATPTVSLHIPWDKTADYRELRQVAAGYGLAFDAMNSNTFQDQKDQPLSYKFGSLSHADAAVRAQAVAHNLECIEIGRALGSQALTVWIADGANFPGQHHLTRAFERYLESAGRIYAALPDDWLMFIEHKLFEPAFYATVINDWGTSYLAASRLGDKARCLVDLGHHAPHTNIEQIVARLIHAGKLAGFHFNDSKYGDDDLDAGSINPYQLFLVFNELVEGAAVHGAAFRPAYMMDQSHNITDPIESLMTSAHELQRAYAMALLVERDALHAFQDGNDAIMAGRTLKRAYATDVDPILAEARRRNGGAIDPVATYRASGYRRRMDGKRPSAAGASGSGIV
jgi:L-rhamnose isomerase / sugar isomerase